MIRGGESRAATEVAIDATGEGLEVTPSLRRTVELAVIQVAQSERDLARAVVMARYAGLSWREIGEATGVSMQSAHQKWTARGVENLRKNMDLLKADD